MKRFVYLITAFFLITLITPAFAADVTTFYWGLNGIFKTGQTTSYQAGDDGDLELGVPTSYTVLTTGQYAGTTNITINSKTHVTSNACVQANSGLMFLREVIQADLGPANDGKLFWEQYTITGESVTFNAAAKTITAAAGNPFDTGALCVGRIFTISGTVSNDGTYTVAVIAGNVITTSEVLVNEGPIATDFATVDDLIRDLRDQANAANLAGYSDWRIPNLRELESITDLGENSPAIDATIFPSTPLVFFWTSTTYDGVATTAWYIHFSNAIENYRDKAGYRYNIRLVR